MDKKVLLAFNIFLVIISVLQIIAGSMTINLGNQLTTDQNSVIYSSVYSAEGNYYIVAGTFTIVLCSLSITIIILTGISIFKAVSAFFISLFIFCLQSSIAVYSAINSYVLSSQSSSFSTFSNEQCSFVTLNNYLTAIAIITWILVCPPLVIDLNSKWQDCKKAGQMQQQQPSLHPQNPKDPLN